MEKCSQDPAFGVFGAFLATNDAQEFQLRLLGFPTGALQLRHRPFPVKTPLSWLRPGEVLAFLAAFWRSSSGFPAAPQRAPVVGGWDTCGLMNVGEVIWGQSNTPWLTPCARGSGTFGHFRVLSGSKPLVGGGRSTRVPADSPRKYELTALAMYTLPSELRNTGARDVFYNAACRYDWRFEWSERDAQQ